MRAPGKDTPKEADSCHFGRSENDAGAADLPFWQEWDRDEGPRETRSCHFGSCRSPGCGSPTGYRIRESTPTSLASLAKAVPVGCSIQGLIAIGRLACWADPTIPKPPSTFWTGGTLKSCPACPVVR